MSSTTKAACEKLLRDAENSALCAVPTNEAELNRLRYLERKRDLASPYPGIFARAESWNALYPSQQVRSTMRTLARIHADWVFVGASAAVAHALAIPPKATLPLRIAKLGAGTCESHEHARRTVVSPCEVTSIDGMRATSLGRTVIDCMRQLGFPEALAVADSYLRATGKSSDQLQAMVSPPRKGARGIRNAQVVARYADGRAESWGESVARAAMIELGFVIPELQTSYVDPVSGMVYRADFSWELPDGQTVLGEMDGLIKYIDESMTGGDTIGAFVRERQRESRLTIGGPRVVRFTPAQVGDKPYFERLLASYGIPRADPLEDWVPLRSSLPPSLLYRYL